MEMQHVKRCLRATKFLLIVLPFLSTQTVLAAAPEWVGGAAGFETDWATAANWANPAAIPGVGDTATFIGAPTVNQPISSGAVTIDGLNFNAATGSYTLTNDSTMTIGINGIVNVSGFTQNIINNDTLALTANDVGANVNITNNSNLDFSGTALASSATVVNNGSLDISAVTAGSTTIGDLSGAGDVVLGANDLLLGGLNTSSTIDGVISGTGALIKNGTGTLTLREINTYSGGTTINAGALQVGDGDFTGNISGGGAIAINGTSDLQFNNLADISVTVPINGTGTLTKNGQGELELTAANTYTGTTTINDGRISLAGSGSLVSNIVNNSQLEFASGGIYAGVISGSGNIFKSGANTLVITGDSSAFTGNVIVTGPYSNNVLQFGDGGTGGSIAADIFADGNSNIQFNRSDTVTYDHVIFGDQPVVGQIGSGTLILTQDQPFISSFSVNAGTLQLGDGSSNTGMLFGNISLASSTNLIFNHTGTVFYSGSVVGDDTTTITKNGDSTLVLESSSSTFLGNTLVNTGTLQIGNGGGSGDLNGSIVLNSDTTLTFNRANSFLMSATISGAGNVVKEGAGLVEFNAPVTYTGLTTVNTGTLGFNDSNFPAGNIVNNASVQFQTIVGDQVYGGVISGSGSLLKRGISSALILTGSNIYTGATDIIGFGSAIRLGNGGTSGRISDASDVLIGNFAELQFDRSDTLTYGGNISGNGSIIQMGTGTTILTGTNLSAGTVRIDAGTLQFGDGTGTHAQIVGSVVNNAALIFDYAGDVTYDEQIFGSGSVTKNGLGTLTFVHDHSYTGETIINAGSLQIGNGTAYGGLISTELVTVNNNANLIFNNADLYTQTAAITGTGNVIKRGPGRLLLTGNNDYSGTTTIEEGRILVSGTGSIDSNVITTTPDTVFAFAPTVANITYPGVVSGPGSLEKRIGNTSLILTGNNTLTGPVIIADNSGNLEVGDGGISGSISSSSGVQVGVSSRVIFNRADPISYNQEINGGGGITQLGSGTLTLGADNHVLSNTIVESGTTLQLGNGGNSGSVTGRINNSGTVIFNRGDTSTYDGVISGSGSVVKEGVGTVILTNNHPYTGMTTINTGTLQFGNGGASGSLITPTLVNAGATLAFDRNGLYTYDAVISGDGGLTKSGLGQLVLTGNNSYTGDTLVNAGILQIGQNSLSGRIVSNNLINNATVMFRQLGDVTYAGVISGNGLLDKESANKLTLTGDSPLFSGHTFISDGILEIGNGGASGMLGGTIQDDATLRFNRSDSVVYNDVISGTGGVQQYGTGVVALNAVNSYSGATTVNSGTLLVGDSVANSTAQIAGDVTVNNGGRFGGHGTVIGNLTNEGVVAPGASIGTLIVNGNYTQPANGTLEIEVNRFGDSDHLQVNGSATLAGTLAVDVSAGFVPNLNYRVISATNGIIGAFDNVTGLGQFSQNFLSGQVSIIGNNVFLAPSFDANALLAAAGNTPNRRAVANYLIGTGGTAGFQSLFGALTSAVQFDETADQVSGSIYANEQIQIAQVGRWFESQLSDRMLLYPDCTAAIDGRSGAHNCQAHRQAWIMPYGTSASIDTGHGGGLDTGAGGLAAGLEFPVARGATAGAAVAVSYFSGDTTGHENANDNGMLYQFGLYGSYKANHWMFGASVDVGGSDDVDTTRNIADNTGANLSVSGNYGTTLVSEQAKASYDAMFKYNTHLRPFVGLVNQSLSSDSFTESGSNVSLAVASTDYNSLRSQIGAVLEIPMQTVTFVSSVAWQHEFEDTQGSFTAQNGALSIIGQDIGRESALVKAGFVLFKQGKMNVTALYEGMFADSYSENGGKLQVNFELT